MRNGPYLLIIPPNNYPGKKYRDKYAYEHHVRFWEKWNRCVSDGCIIHHINGNKHDNCWQNLQEMELAKHVAHHARKPIRHGTVAGYNRKCRCDLCKSAKNADVRRYRLKYGRKKYKKITPG